MPCTKHSEENKELRNQQVHNVDKREGTTFIKANSTIFTPRPHPKSLRYSSKSTPKPQRQEQVSPATLFWKRRNDSNSKDKEHQPKRARLTRKNLALFNKTTEMKGSHKMAAGGISKPVTDSLATRTTKTTSTTTPGFALKASKNGILSHMRSKAPANLEDIRRRYAESCTSVSPTESVYERYVKTVDNAQNESTMLHKTSHALLKEYDDGYNQAINQAFTNFPKDVGFNNCLSAPKPDFIEGLAMKEFGPFPISEYVNGAVLHRDDPNSLTLPHLAGEWKMFGKSMKEAAEQSAYDGAALVYARNEALSYLGRSDPPGHAEIMTFATDGTSLKTFAHYRAASENGTVEYHQYPVASVFPTDSRQALKYCQRALRNMQDYARKQSYALRDALIEHWKLDHDDVPNIAHGIMWDVGSDGAGHMAVEQPISSSRSFAAEAGQISCSSGQKRKASPSQSPRKVHRQVQEYWKWNAEEEKYFHKHSDNKVTWFEESDDDGNEDQDNAGPLSEYP